MEFADKLSTALAEATMPGFQGDATKLADDILNIAKAEHDQKRLHLLKLNARPNQAPYDFLILGEFQDGLFEVKVFTYDPAHDERGHGYRGIGYITGGHFGKVVTVHVMLDANVRFYDIASRRNDLIEIIMMHLDHEISHGDRQQRSGVSSNDPSGISRIMAHNIAATTNLDYRRAPQELDADFTAVSKALRRDGRPTPLRTLLYRRYISYGYTQALQYSTDPVITNWFIRRFNREGYRVDLRRGGPVVVYPQRR